MNNPHLIRRTNSDDFVNAEEGRVSIVEQHGTMTQCFEPGYFIRLTFLAYDTEDNAYVCDTDVNQVYQISADLSKCRALISDLKKIDRLVLCTILLRRC